MLAGIRPAAVVANLLLMAAAVAAEPSVTLHDAWVRALPPTQSNTAAYLTVHNSGTEPVVIDGARTALAGRVELHDSVTRDGMARMEQREAITVAAGEKLHFAPGGLHLMLLELEHMPAAGEELEICLRVAGEFLCTLAVTRKSGPAAEHDAHQHH
ncbi:copper chaperone PCu(A)C [Kineobactrum salinum]|uniref:Copper chaperone PCu(A)C n=1 Tax=Kineobactrum salinum TaxID=2708301 RepID=A0A6C0U1L4_9GAMM|nr:copper chaperone PCu(A)C [Kineobactrum salinum]QIB66000.1 copper chaperone PCu(A)C [Kineobactrum salinum]